MDNEIRLLNQAIRRLLTSGENAPSGEELTGLSREILDRADRLYPSRGQTATEEASLCATLLMAYNTSMYGPADRLERVNALLRRAEAVLPLLGSDVPERVRLLAWCYAEVEEESLLLEAEAIVAGWARPLASDRLLAAGEVALMRESLIINP